MYQKLVLVGYLGGDPEMRYMPDGSAVTNFSLATNRQWTDKANGELNKETTWFRISVWGKQAENANQYLKRGSQVLIEGVIKSDPITGGPRIFTQKDGRAGASFEVTADVVRFMRSKDGATTGPKPDTTNDDDIPF